MEMGNVFEGILRRYNMTGSPKSNIRRKRPFLPSSDSTSFSLPATK